MSNVYTAAGTQFMVTTTLPTTFDTDPVTGWPSVEAGAVVVGEVTGVPEHGPTYELVTHIPLADRVVIKRKGSVNYGSFTLPIALDPVDAGQVICRNFADGPNVDDSLGIIIITKTGQKRYFTAQVMSFMEAFDSADSIAAGSIMLEIDSSIVFVDNITATLTYTAGANGSLIGTSPQTVNIGGSGTPVAAVPDDTFAFVDWSDGSTANPRVDSNVAGDITVTANFA